MLLVVCCRVSRGVEPAQKKEGKKQSIRTTSWKSGRTRELYNRTNEEMKESEKGGEGIWRIVLSSNFTDITRAQLYGNRQRKAARKKESRRLRGSSGVKHGQGGNCSLQVTGANEKGWASPAPSEVFQMTIGTFFLM